MYLFSKRGEEGRFEGGKQEKSGCAPAAFHLTWLPGTSLAYAAHPVYTAPASGVYSHHTVVFLLPYVRSKLVCIERHSAESDSSRTDQDNVEQDLKAGQHRSLEVRSPGEQM